MHVTHVDASEEQAKGDVAGAGHASEGAGKVGGAEDVGAGDDKPVEVRFLDVPGSEQTREEKMTIIFTCTVGVSYFRGEAFEEVSELNLVTIHGREARKHLLPNGSC